MQPRITPHNTHRSVTRARNRARAAVWWPVLAAHSAERRHQFAGQITSAQRGAGDRAAILTVAVHQHREIFNRDLGDAAAISRHEPGVDNVAFSFRDVGVLEQAPHVYPAFRTPCGKCGHRTTPRQERSVERPVTRDHFGRARARTSTTTSAASIARTIAMSASGRAAASNGHAATSAAAAMMRVHTILRSSANQNAAKPQT